jgi:hypothetical protein
MSLLIRPKWGEKLLMEMNRRISVEMIVAPASEKANGLAAVTRLAGSFYNFSPSLRAISICPSRLYKTRILNGRFVVQVIQLKRVAKTAWKIELSENSRLMGGQFPW